MTGFLFYGFALLALGCAGFAVFGRHREPWLGPLCLLVSMVALGAVFILDGAYLVGCAQIFLYGGAPLALLFCVTSLVPQDPDERAFRRTLQVRRLVAVCAVASLVTLLGFASLSTGSSGEANVRSFGDLPGVGMQLFRTYLLPLEASAFLLLVAALAVATFTRDEEQ